ncbi:MAG: hypothetical protein R2712_27940 [Vicinamibacterales bacterium]
MQVVFPIYGASHPRRLVGALQFDIVEARMKNEYGVTCQVDKLPHTARWLDEDAPRSLKLPQGPILETVDREGAACPAVPVGLGAAVLARTEPRPCCSPSPEGICPQVGRTPPDELGANGRFPPPRPHPAAGQRSCRRLHNRGHRHRHRHPYLGFGLVIRSVLLGGSLVAFINAPGILIVLGGTIARPR